MEQQQFLLRKLLSEDDDDDKDKDLHKFCNFYCPSYPRDCPSDCLSKCQNRCSYPAISDSPSKSPQKLSNLVSATIALLSFVFLLVLCYAVYTRFYSGRRARRGAPPPAAPHHQEFLDEEQGPVLDHPIWYIRTVGLPAAAIGAIAVYRFNSGEGLVDGTECSVCLSEFEDGEALRLLPKCSHAFHLPCIDTWLRSHTTCPLCRAPILAPSAAAAPPQEEITHMGDSENSERDLGADEEEEEEDEIVRSPGGGDLEQRVSDFQPVRRSVSLDSVAALGISSVVGGLHDQRVNCSSSELGQKWAASAAMNRSLSCSGKFLIRSSTQRSSGTNHN